MATSSDSQPEPERSLLVAWLASFFESDSPHAETRRLRLVRAIKRGNIEAVITQLKLHPSDVELVDEAGQTPLFYAQDALVLDY